MADAGASFQPAGAFHLICAEPGARAAGAATAGDCGSAPALQTEATHFTKSSFCASTSSELPRILKNNVAPVLWTKAAIILPSRAASAPEGKPVRSTTVTSPMEV